MSTEQDELTQTGAPLTGILPEVVEPKYAGIGKMIGNLGPYTWLAVAYQEETDPERAPFWVVRVACPERKMGVRQELAGPEKDMEWYKSLAGIDAVKAYILDAMLAAEAAIPELAQEESLIIKP